MLIVVGRRRNANESKKKRLNVSVSTKRSSSGSKKCTSNKLVRMSSSVISNSSAMVMFKMTTMDSTSKTNNLW